METPTTTEPRQVPKPEDNAPAWEQLLAEAPDRWELNGDINAVAPWVKKWAEKKRLTATVFAGAGMPRDHRLRQDQR